MELIKQRSLEWHELRLGKFTASTIYKIMGTRAILSGKDGTELEHWSEGAQTFILEKVSESFGVFQEEAYSKAMDWGIENESYAKRHYEKAYGVELQDREFIMAQFCKHAGMSPDSYIIGQNKGVEFKCPYNPANHIRYMLIKNSAELLKASKQYYYQVQMCMLVSGFKKWDFVTYDPRYENESGMMMYAVEIQRNDEECEIMKDRILKCVDIVNKIVESLK